MQFEKRNWPPQQPRWPVSLIATYLMLYPLVSAATSKPGGKSTASIA